MPPAPLRGPCVPTLDGKEGRGIPVAVLEAAFDAPGVPELHIMDYHLRDGVAALLIAGGGKAVVGDDGLCGSDAQHHHVIQSPHDEPPARRDGAVEASLRALQHRCILGAFYDLIAGSRSWKAASFSRR